MYKHARPASLSRRAAAWSASFRLLRASAPVVVAVSAFVFASFAPRQAAATEYYWDPNGATSEGGSGTWDTATPNWAPTSTATASTTVYDNGTASIAHFGTVAGTVTIANGLAINVNTLTFDLTGGQNTGYTIAGGTGSTLNFSGTTPSVVSNSGTQETITAAVTGTAGLTETNATTSGSNSSTTANGYALRLQGDLSGLSGTVNVGNGNTTNGGGYIALGTGAANYTSSQYQTWNIAANGLLTGNNQGTGYTYSLGALSGAGILRGGSSNGGAPAGTDTFQIGALNTSTAFSGTIGDKATGSVLTAMTKVGTGTLTLSGTNTYTGGTTVSAGTLALNGADNGTGVVRGVVTVNSNATLSLVSRNALGYSNTTVSVTTLNVVGGTVDNAAPTNVSNGDQGFLTNFNLTGGKMTSTGGGLYNINPGDTSAPSITSNASGTLSLISGGVAIRGGTLNVNVASGTTTSGVDLQISGVISGAALTKTGSGYLNLTGQNTFTGAVNVTAGTLNIGTGAANDGSTGALGLSNAGKTITVSQGATLSGTFTNWFGNQANTGTFPSITVNGGTLSTTRYTPIGPITLNGATMTATDTADAGNYQTYALRGNVTVGGTAASTITSTSVDAMHGGYHLGANTIFTVATTGAATPDLTVSAPLINQSGDFGNAAGGLTKAGAGVMALTATNTYTGPTVVSAGTLLVNGSTASGSTVTVNNSGTILGGTGTVAGTVNVSNGAIISAGNTVQALTGNLTTGALTLATGSTFNALLTSNTNFSTLRAGGTTALGGAAFSINTTPGATFTSGSTLELITSPVTGNFTNTTYTAGGYNFMADYTTNSGFFSVDITAVPEPATWIAGFLLVGVAVGSQRRKVSDWLCAVRG